MTPPPASQTEKPQWLWSRPMPGLPLTISTAGVRPNSPPQRTSVSSNSPRCLRSVRRAAIAWSQSWASLRWFSGDVVVAVPGLDVAVVELDEPHAPLDQAAGDQELPGLHARAVGVADVLRLLLDVEGVGGGHLHAVGQLEAGDPRLEGIVLGPRLAGGDGSARSSRSSCRR